jgi:hypothetical protein
MRPSAERLLGEKEQLVMMQRREGVIWQWKYA